MSTCSWLACVFDLSARKLNRLTNPPINCQLNSCRQYTGRWFQWKRNVNNRIHYNPFSIFGHFDLNRFGCLKVSTSFGA